MPHPRITDADYFPLPGFPDATAPCPDCAAVRLIYEDCQCVGCAIAAIEAALTAGEVQG